MTGARPLGPTERSFWLLDQAAPLNCVVVAHVTGSLHRGIVRAALDTLQRRHPLLRVRVRPGASPAYCSQDVGPIALRVVERATEDRWRDVLQAELDQPLPWQTGPLARAVLVGGEHASELLLTFHHMIGDGRSAVVLVRDLLSAAARDGHGDPPRVCPERPALEDLLPAEVRGVRGLGRGVALLARQAPGMLHRPDRLAREHDAPPADRRTGVIHAALSAQATDRLAVRCREQGTTVHAVICAAAVSAAAAEIRAERDRSDSLVLSCLSAIDVRPRLRTDVTDELGLFASRIVTRHRIAASAPFWDLAREVKARTGAAMRRDEPLVLAAVQGRLLRAKARPADLARQAETLGAVAAAVSNLGRVSIPGSYGPLELTGIHVAAGPHTLGTGLGVVAGTFQGRLMLNLLHAQPLVSTRRASRLAASLLGHLGGSDAWTVVPPPATLPSVAHHENPSGGALEWTSR